MKSTPNLLMFADSEHDADMLYAVGMFVPDPFIYLRIRGRACVVMSDLEIDRAKHQAPHCQVISLSACQKKVAARGGKSIGAAAIIDLLAREKGARSFVVPRNFPLGLALELQRLGIRLQAAAGSLFPAREFKSADEIRKLTAAVRMAEAGMAAGIRMLKASRIGPAKRLIHGGRPLTSERLRSAIDTAVLQAGGQASHTIVAGGKQGCDPHEGGHGPLRAHEPIILDIFPRCQETGYFGDITRTVVRGRASEAIRRLYQTVFDGQQLGFSRMRPGTESASIHGAIQDLFHRSGYKTGRVGGRMQGFFHGTGHGLGLEIHEAPRVGATSSGKLQPGQVVTVEPGLYYPSIGGVRLEDVAVITGGAPRNLTRFEKVLEI
ncbi:MAG: Xaa-Pro peptidase family protein [Verrucomicrobiota bacterium]